MYISQGLKILKIEATWWGRRHDDAYLRHAGRLLPLVLPSVWKTWLSSIGYSVSSLAASWWTGRVRPLDLLAMLHLARPTLPPFLSPLVNPRRSSSSSALNAFCPIFCFPLPSRLSLVWLSSSCYTPLGFLTLSVSWNYWKRAKKNKKNKKKKREAKGNKNKKKENRA